MKSLALTREQSLMYTKPVQSFDYTELKLNFETIKCVPNHLHSHHVVCFYLIRFLMHFQRIFANVRNKRTEMDVHVADFNSLGKTHWPCEWLFQNTKRIWRCFQVQDVDINTIMWVEKVSRMCTKNILTKHIIWAPYFVSPQCLYSSNGQTLLWAALRDTRKNTSGKWNTPGHCFKHYLSGVTLLHK